MRELGASIWLELARASATIILLNEHERFLWETWEPGCG